MERPKFRLILTDRRQGDETTTQEVLGGGEDGGPSAAFERNGKRKPDVSQERIAALEAKVRRKDEVLGELMEEHVALKKELGEL